MKNIDGKKISNQIKDEIKKEVDSIIASNQKVPLSSGSCWRRWSKSYICRKQSPFV